MASMNVDKPLDDLIKENPSGRRGRGRGRGGSSRKRVSGGGATGAVKAVTSTSRAQRTAATNASRPPVVIPGRGGGGAMTGSKIIMSNLPLDVTEAQVRELLSSSVGPLRKIVMSYKQSGQSTGVCTVEFQRRDDANKAYQQYNNRLIDGKKPLRVEVVVDPTKVPLQGQAVKAANGGGARGGAAPGGGAGASARGGAAGRGRGRGRGGRAARPQKTLEDLDAEMEDYAKGAAAEGSAAPAAPAA